MWHTARSTDSTMGRMASNCGRKSTSSPPSTRACCKISRCTRMSPTPRIVMDRGVNSSCTSGSSLNSAGSATTSTLGSGAVGVLAAAGVDTCSVGMIGTTQPIAAPLEILRAPRPRRPSSAPTRGPRLLGAACLPTISNGEAPQGIYVGATPDLGSIYG